MPYLCCFDIVNKDIKEGDFMKKIVTIVIIILIFSSEISFANSESIELNETMSIEDMLNTYNKFTPEFLQVYGNIKRGKSPRNYIDDFDIKGDNIIFKVFKNKSGHICNIGVIISDVYSQNTLIRVGRSLIFSSIGYKNNIPDDINYKVIDDMIKNSFIGNIKFVYSPITNRLYTVSSSHDDEYNIWYMIVYAFPKK